MEIEQYIYDLNASGEAIVAYKMVAENGGMVEICNMAASILSWSLRGEGCSMVDLASGRCVRGLRGIDHGDMWGGVKFEELLWESRVETNRVVMSLSWESDGVGIMSEVVFDYDDDNTLEITYIACADSPYEIDLTHKLKFNMQDGALPQIKSQIEPSANILHYPISDAQKSILNPVASLNSAGHNIEILSSQPAIYLNATQHEIAPITIPTQHVNANERYIQKNCYRLL